jgi:hypothetical protein
MIALLVAALLTAAGQHSMNLCRPTSHEARTTAAESTPRCHHHAGAPAPAEHTRVPSCCAPSAALLSLPSAKGAVAVKATGGPAPAWISVQPATAGFTLRPATTRVIERAGSFYSRLRLHLALRTILL